MNSKASHAIVSVIIPCYNQAQFMPDALESVLAQTHRNWECIIVNDGSPDNTEEVAKEWLKKDGRFKYIKKENGGLSSARNAGLKVAKGEYIQFLDSDDILESDKIMHQINTFVRFNNEIDVALSGYRYFSDSTKAECLKIYGPSDIIPEVSILRTDKSDVLRLFAKKNPMVISAPLYHRSVFERVGHFDEALHAVEDWDFHLRCALEGIIFHHIGFADHTKTLIRLHDGSMMKNKQRMDRNINIFLTKHKNNPVFAKEHRMSASSKGTMKLILLNYLKLLTPPIFPLVIRKLFKYE